MKKAIKAALLACSSVSILGAAAYDGAREGLQGKRERNRKNRLLIRAARHGDRDAVAFLLDIGANCNAIRQRDDSTVLMCAARYGHTDVVRLLIDAGVRCNAIIADHVPHQTALEVASDRGHEDIVWVLLGCSAGFRAMCYRRLCAVRAAIGAGHFTVARGMYGVLLASTLRCLSREFRHYDCFEAMQRVHFYSDTAFADAFNTWRGDWGASFIAEFMYLSDSGPLRGLLEYGVRPVRVLKEAITSNSGWASLLALEYGADPDEPCSRSKTALEMAIASRKVVLVKLLLANRIWGPRAVHRRGCLRKLLMEGIEQRVQAALPFMRRQLGRGNACREILAEMANRGLKLLSVDEKSIIHCAYRSGAIFIRDIEEIVARRSELVHDKVGRDPGNLILAFEGDGDY